MHQISNLKMADWPEFSKMVVESTLLNETEVNDASREAAEKTFVKIFLEAAKRSQPVTTPRNYGGRKKLRNLENCCFRPKVNS